MKASRALLQSTRLCADKPATVSFYLQKTRQLLEDRQLAGSRLNAIDEAAIDGDKQRRTRQESRRKRPLSPPSVNRVLVTLRRLLRLAQEWKVIDRVPRIRLLRDGNSYSTVNRN